MKRRHALALILSIIFLINVIACTVLFTLIRFNIIDSDFETEEYEEPLEDEIFYDDTFEVLTVKDDKSEDNASEDDYTYDESSNGGYALLFFLFLIVCFLIILLSPVWLPFVVLALALMVLFYPTVMLMHGYLMISWHLCVIYSVLAALLSRYVQGKYGIITNMLCSVICKASIVMLALIVPLNLLGIILL